jgi:predicted TIM-barrel fold metal-dependent hydrolase
MTGASEPSANARAILGVPQEPLRFVPPAGACDCHTHVFGPPSTYPYAADRQYTPGLASAEDLLALQRALGLDRVVVVQPSPYGSDNRCTLDALRALGDRARGVAVIDERTTDAQLRDMHAAGVRGIRINLETHGIADVDHSARQLAWAGARVAALGWHLQLYTNLSMVARLAPAIRALPTDVVLDHFGRATAALGTGQPHLDALLALLSEGRLWLKLSAPQRISQTPDDDATAQLSRFLIQARPDRMVWGSDWPHPGARAGQARDPSRIEDFNPVDDGHALNRLHRWTAGSDALGAILVDNPARLYDFAN